MNVLKASVFSLALALGIGFAMLFGFELFNPVASAFNAFNVTHELIHKHEKVPHCSQASLGERCDLGDDASGNQVVPFQTMAKLKTRMSNLQRWEKVDSVTIDYGDVVYKAIAGTNGIHIKITILNGAGNYLASGNPYKEIDLYDRNSDGIVDYGVTADFRSRQIKTMNPGNLGYYQDSYHEAITILESNFLD